MAAHRGASTASMKSRSPTRLRCGRWDWLTRPQCESLRHRGGRFDDRIELDGVTTLFAGTEARSLSAAKRHMVVDAGDRQIHHHHARFGIALEVAGILQARGADAG